MSIYILLQRKKYNHTSADNRTNSNYGKSHSFEKALHNIVSNAVRHSPIKSNVYVTLSTKELVIKNEGITIPDNDLDKIFTPFYRVEKSIIN